MDLIKFHEKRFDLFQTPQWQTTFENPNWKIEFNILDKWKIVSDEDQLMNMSASTTIYSHSESLN